MKKEITPEDMKNVAGGACWGCGCYFCDCCPTDGCDWFGQDWPFGQDGR